MRRMPAEAQPVSASLWWGLSLCSWHCSKIMPYWVEATASVEKDPACKEAFG